MRGTGHMSGWCQHVRSMCRSCMVANKWRFYIGCSSVFLCMITSYPLSILTTVILIPEYLGYDTRHCPGTWAWVIGAMQGVGWVSPVYSSEAVSQPFQQFVTCHDWLIEMDPGSWELMGDTLLISSHWTGRAEISVDVETKLQAKQFLMLTLFREKIRETNIYADWEDL